MAVVTICSDFLLSLIVFWGIWGLTIYLVAQMVKSLPAMRETWVRSLSWEDALEEGMATQSSILAWRILMDKGACWATVYRVTKNQTQLSD